MLGSPEIDRQSPANELGRGDCTFKDYSCKLNRFLNKSKCFTGIEAPVQDLSFEDTVDREDERENTHFT